MFFAVLLHLFQAKEILEGLWDNEYEFCSFIGDLWQSGSEKTDCSMFFMESVLVPPTKFRAPTKGGDSVSNFWFFFLVIIVGIASVG